MDSSGTVLISTFRCTLYAGNLVESKISRRPEYDVGAFPSSSLKTCGLAHLLRRTTSAPTHQANGPLHRSRQIKRALDQPEIRESPHQRYRPHVREAESRNVRYSLYPMSPQEEQTPGLSLCWQQLSPYNQACAQ